MEFRNDVVAVAHALMWQRRWRAIADTGSGVVELSPSAPGLWAISQDTDVSPQQMALVIPLVLASSSLVLLSWKRLQLDR